ncbi:type II secretion system major pseudopilin GspG [Bdellovibrio bacteriovorus]|uniref:type II secretion system major pseudopilin GspG n=1 Tax=Bdellovibrio bacteriovorus TaxID=959 RepID=UPI0021D18D6E|nr:type II secretion system major pseudopilin GspG [Bdellovibrio bacteriovorus]UXR63860.1 type II secretion system major pseudopilin GspG [Bdellovibrio bacteriovorus]
MSLLKNRKGMTLIEIMIVLAIIGGIAALLLPNITGQLDKSKAKEAKIQLTQIVNALSMYYTDCGKYPQSLEGLTKQDPNCSNWGPQPYYTKKLQDPFGHDLVYELDGGEYSLKSLGKDGREGGSGFDKDITLEDLN